MATQRKPERIDDLPGAWRKRARSLRRLFSETNQGRRDNLRDAALLNECARDLDDILIEDRRRHDELEYARAEAPEGPYAE